MTIRVVGAGLGRTGTTSLKAALEQLLGAPCRHMFEFFVHPEHVPGWHAAARGEAEDWSALLDGYAAVVDWPGASFWPELTAAFPDAVVLVSNRDPDAWYESAINTIFPNMINEVAEDQSDDWKAWHAMVRDVFDSRFTLDLADKEATLAAFDAHYSGGAGRHPRRPPARVDRHRRLGPDLRRPRRAGARRALPPPQRPRRLGPEGRHPLIGRRSVTLGVTDRGDPGRRRSRRRPGRGLTGSALVVGRRQVPAAASRGPSNRFHTRRRSEDDDAEDDRGLQEADDVTDLPPTGHPARRRRPPAPRSTGGCPPRSAR